MIFLSLGPGVVYVIFGYIYNLLYPALLWYSAVFLSSIYGIYLYTIFQNTKMEYEELRLWYNKMIVFMYVIFSLWTVVFFIFCQETESNLHFIAIFTQLGTSVVASALLVSERKIFIPILLILMLPLSIYFFAIGLWYGYVLAVFSLIFVAVLLYSSNNTYRLIEESYYHANHDILTGLYNRKYYLEYMDAMVERLDSSHKEAYVLLIDLDRFKAINDSLGHDVGDEVLKEVSFRLQDFCQYSRVVARLGGDEFIIVSRELNRNENSKHKINDIAERLLMIIKEPYIIKNHHLYISASIGISYITSSESISKNFLKEADIAMYEAKNTGKDGVIFFNASLEKSMNHRLKIEQKLYAALMKKDICLCYQVQVDKNTNLVGCEVLSRWYDEELGEISPNEFIPIAESTGLIIKLGMYILVEAFQTLEEWHEKLFPIAQLSINISVRQLFDKGFVEDVSLLFAQYIREDNRIQIIFEITENILVEDIEKITKILLELKAMGIYFSMDDFGTGYSSLSYLRNLPIDELKIDKLFIDHLLESEEDKTMVLTMLSISKNFGLNVVIEGVENQKQFELLSQYDCNIFQGYLFSEPIDKKDFEERYLL